MADKTVHCFKIIIEVTDKLVISSRKISPIIVRPSLLPSEQFITRVDVCYVITR